MFSKVRWNILSQASSTNEGEREMVQKKKILSKISNFRKFPLRSQNAYLGLIEKYMLVFVEHPRSVGSASCKKLIQSSRSSS